MSDSAQFVLGVDLGTTNSVAAYAPLGDAEARLRVLPVEQLVAPGVVERLPCLPSFLYVLSADERRSQALALPGEGGAAYVVGTLARDLGIQQADRLVTSAKSWLCVPQVDRTQPLLPWGAGEDVEKVSPVDASARYLQRIVKSWNAAFPEHPCERQKVVLTVPASFDPTARELTLQAARQAGLGEVTLLEEPQAAFYAWLHRTGEDWRHQLELGDCVLVCDIGGGTTDFSAIQVIEHDGQLALERVAVGNHILLGGDNMDLALAEALHEQLAAHGVRLDAWQQRSLLHACRDAKERLLSSPELDTVPLAIAGRGSRLIGGAIRTELRRSLVQEALLEGFFPEVALQDRPDSALPELLQEWGLPYATDPAVTRHLAHFLVSVVSTGRGRGGLKPTAVLFNGGVFRATVIRDRLLAQLCRWFPDAPQPVVLTGADLQQAVALGAAYYGWANAHGGVRIRSHLPHAYYVAVAAALPSVPGRRAPLRALCVAPRGLAEGSEVELAQREFALAIGQNSEFRVLRSTSRNDKVGTLVEEIDDQFEWLAPVTVRIEGTSETGRIPVRLRARVSEVGALELWCTEKNGPGRWRLAFDLRATRPLSQRG